MSIARDKVLAKIKALLAKTVENGCTEAEAMAALTMAQSMMDSYEVTEEDIQLKDEEANIEQSEMRDPNRIRRCLAISIGEFTNTKVWQHSHKIIKFCGTKSDTEFAVWLLETLSQFVMKELANHLWRIYKEVNDSNKRWHVNGFIFGCTRRIDERLNELNAASKRQATANKNALVIAKNNLIVRKMQEVGISLRTPRKRSSSIIIDSYKAGKIAGDKATFGRPMSGQQATLRLK